MVERNALNISKVEETIDEIKRVYDQLYQAVADTQNNIDDFKNKWSGVVAQNFFAEFASKINAVFNEGCNGKSVNASFESFIKAIMEAANGQAGVQGVSGVTSTLLNLQTMSLNANSIGIRFDDGGVGMEVNLATDIESQFNDRLEIIKQAVRGLIMAVSDSGFQDENGSQQSTLDESAQLVVDEIGNIFEQYKAIAAETSYKSENELLEEIHMTTAAFRAR